MSVVQYISTLFLKSSGKRLIYHASTKIQLTYKNHSKALFYPQLKSLFSAVHITNLAL